MKTKPPKAMQVCRTFADSLTDASRLWVRWAIYVTVIMLLAQLVNTRGF